MPGWIQIGDPFPPTWEGKPPQMLDKDVPVWDEYRRKTLGFYEKFYYNVAMTLIELDVSHLTPSLQKQAYYSVSKRVDVMAVKGSHKYLIEVTGRAAVRSVGQILTYLHLYKLITGETDVSGMIVCNYTDADIRSVCDAYGVKIVELHPL